MTVFRTLGMAAAIALAGFVSASRSEPPLPLPDDQVVVDGYRLDAGDRLRITVYNEPSLTGEYGITTAGNVSFPLIGEVAAKGRTVETLQSALRDRLGKGYVNDPRVSVEIVNYRPYYILGEVNKPGEYPYAVGIKVQQAIAAAGGYTYRANRGTIFLSRAEEKERGVKIAKQPFLIMPGDTIRVGERYF